MDREEFDSLITVAETAVKIHAWEKYKLPVRKTDENGFLSSEHTVRVVCDMPNHKNAVQDIPVVMRGLIFSHDAEMSEDPAINRLAVQETARALYDKTLQVDSKAYENIRLKSPDQIFIEKLEAAKHPTPVKHTRARALFEKIRHLGGGRDDPPGGNAR